MNFDLVSVIKGIAPMLATALGGPFAGMAVKAIAGAVLPDADAQLQAAGQTADPITALKNAVIQSIQTGVANIAALKQAENDFKVKMAELGYTNEAALAKIAAEDRADARKREEVVRDEMPKILAVLIVVMWGLIQWHLINQSIPADMREIVMRVLGTLDGALMLALTYYFGTTASSRQKDDTIAKAVSPS